MGARRLLAVAAAWSFAATAAAAAPCPELQGAATVASAEGFRISYRLDPKTPAVSEAFALELSVCGPSGAYEGPFRVDADMPAHRHGMNYRPTVTPVAPGRFRADGMVLHMQGDWRFTFEAATADGPVRLTADYRQP